MHAANKITKQQLDTILERVQTFKDYKHIKTVSILDEHGQFTREAQTILFPSLFGGIAYNNLTNKQLKNFKLLIEKLPKSEQIFYTTAGGDQLANLPFIRSFLDFQAILIDPTNNKNLVHLSKGVEDALNQVRFGKDCVTRVSTLGDKTYIG